MAVRGGQRRDELLVGVTASIGVVALVTAVVAILDTWMPVLSLGALYVFAVLPIAIVWGVGYAIPVAVVSMLAFNWFFLPPRHTFSLADRENWLVLALYVVVAVVTSELASSARRRAAAAELRERETAAVAEIATILLREPLSTDTLARVSARVADALEVPQVTITLGAAGSGFPLEVDGTTIGALDVDGGRPDDDAAARVLPAVASLIAFARNRDALQEEAVEAEMLRRSDAVKTAILRTISHDLRSPLTAISAAVSSLTSPSLHLDDEGRSELLETIGVESTRLGRLVADLLDLSRLQAGAAHPRRELHTADELIALVLDELPADAPVVVDVPPELGLVDVDAVQIVRALVNVIENGIHHTPTGGVVQVSAEDGDGSVVVLVRDDGPGVPTGEAERIFEPFHRADTAHGHRGSGLGLAIARGFAEENGATLAVLPSDHGALFALTLPARAMVEARR
jgi:two-component system, OmpR family, sensor histidine kinase KdpD